MRLPLAFAATAVLLLTAPLISAQDTGMNWQTILQSRLPLYGHRNWIVITDSAYPVQSSPGIETITSNADYFQVLQTVFGALQRSRHVTPIVYTDRELPAVAENDAPGITAFRDQLNTFLNGAQLRNPPTTNLKHDELISKLTEVSQSFRVLVIKTDAVLPYTSLFLQLDCAYWNPDAEHRLRMTLAAQR